MAKGNNKMHNFLNKWLPDFHTSKENDSFKDIMEALGHYDTGCDVDDYEWLMEQKEFFQKEHEKAKKELVERECILRQQDLYRLLSLPYDKRYEKYEELSKDKLFKKENIIVFLCFINSLEHQSIYSHVNRGMSRIVLKKMMDDVFKGSVTIEVVDMLDCYACIVNTEKDGAEGRELLEASLDELQHFMVNNMSLQPIYAFGGWKKGIDNVHASYMLAREAVGYQRIISGTQFVWFEDIRTKHMIYQYSLDTEQKLINAICVGNSKDVNQWIDEILEINYHERDITHQMKKCLIADLLGTLFKGAELAGDSKFVAEYMEEKIVEGDWSGKLDESLVRQYLHDMVNRLCKEICDNHTTRQDDKQFGMRVMEYVKENYHDPDLNISIAALHFGITPSYLSTLFKEQTGLNLLEYINHIRVEAAKKLLEEGYSLTEVSDRTGFRSSGALIRVFKKETGITPGQMRKIFSYTNDIYNG